MESRFELNFSGVKKPALTSCCFTPASGGEAKHSIQGKDFSWGKTANAVVAMAMCAVAYKAWQASDRPEATFQFVGETGSASHTLRGSLLKDDLPKWWKNVFGERTVGERHRSHGSQVFQSVRPPKSPNRKKGKRLSAVTVDSENYPAERIRVSRDGKETSSVPKLVELAQQIEKQGGWKTKIISPELTLLKSRKRAPAPSNEQFVLKAEFRDGTSQKGKDTDLPRGPHKKWAVFVEKVRQELGWTLDEMCEFTGVQIGWLKKARSGKKVRGEYRKKFEDGLNKRWEKKFPNKALKWPAWVSGASLSEPDIVSAPASANVSGTLLKNADGLRPEDPKAFVLRTNEENLGGTDFRRLYLGGGRLEVVRCKIETESPYFRFGFKLLKENGRLFGDDSITTSDENRIVHIGRNNWDRLNIGVLAKDIFITCRLNGRRLKLNDEKMFSTGRRLSASVELRIDSDYVMTFSVNGIRYMNRPISPELCRRVFIAAWGDGEEYEVKVSDLSINLESGS